MTFENLLFSQKILQKSKVSMDYVVKSPAQQLKVKAQLSLSPKLSSKLNPEAQVRLSSVVHYSERLLVSV